MKSSNKGSAFERKIAKTLSLWWTHGEREDVFWRSQASGARATQRRKTAQKTFGQEGDIQATDPIGQPLIDFFTIELKHGYSGSTIHDLLDKLPSERTPILGKFFEQAQAESLHAGAVGWCVIFQRNRKQALMFIPFSIWKRLALRRLLPKPYMTLRLEEGTVYGFPLENFLKVVPSGLVQMALTEAREEPK